MDTSYPWFVTGNKTSCRKSFRWLENCL